MRWAVRIASQSMATLARPESFERMDRLDEFELPGVARPDMSNVAPPNDYGGYKGSASSHHHVYDNVVDVLLNGAAVATPIEEGLAVVRVIAQAHALGRS